MGNLGCKENDAYSEFVALMDRTSRYTGDMVDSISYLKANPDEVSAIVNVPLTRTINLTAMAYVLFMNYKDVAIVTGTMPSPVTIGEDPTPSYQRMVSDIRASPDAFVEGLMDRRAQDVSLWTLNKLQSILMDPDFAPDALGQWCYAASELCQFLVAATKAAEIYNSAWQLATTKLGPTERDMISAGEESDQRVLYNATCSTTSCSNSTAPESPRPPTSPPSTEMATLQAAGGQGLE
ncbi:hypothetical protein FOL47_002880 [Perkinsus chesapeaki]|uniref:Uncharacterized protein n=1 Tax=Perkinsus chesapeaki TaxID=330153 RepID=A0A7J6MB37_PERCH|nr:hypothetical protein FOL47_002880 [Perkinsus chesapeaki]